MAVPVANLKIKLDGEAEYRAALSSIDKSFKELGSEMNLLSAKFSKNGDSMEALSAKSDVLSKKVETQQKRVDTLKKAVAEAQAIQEKAQKTFDETASTLDAGSEEYKTMAAQVQKTADQTAVWQTKLNNAEAELYKMKDALEDNSSQLAKTTEDLGDMGQKAGDAKRETMGLGSTVDQLTSKLGFSLPDGLKNAMDGMEKVDLKAAALVGTFAGVAAAIVGAEKKLASLTTEAGASAKELRVLSEVTGQSTDELQEFDYMSKFLGVSTDQLSDGLKEITNKMQEARDGSADAADAFNRLGIRVTDSRGELRDAGEVFYEVIDALGDMKNQTERDATAMDLLSESARNFNPLITRGSEVMKAFAEEAHNTGYVLSEETLKTLTQVDDAYQHMLLSQEASKNQLAEEFAPYLTEFYQNLDGMITDLSTAAADSGLIDLFGSLLDLASSLAPVLSSLADAASSLKPIFETLATAISGVAEALSKVNQFASNFGGGLSSVVSNLGIGGSSFGAISSIGSGISLFKSVSNMRQGRHATGTDNYIGGVTWVGENGPELVYLPQRTQISSAQESRRIVGGDTFYVTINAKDVKSFNDVVRMSDNKRRATRMGVK